MSQQVQELISSLPDDKIGMNLLIFAFTRNRTRFFPYNQFGSIVILHTIDCFGYLMDPSLIMAREHIIVQKPIGNDKETI